ncbi:MAG: UDP-N-acetylmuramoyl-L-alanine--D-glutamate ligase [Dehalococcoidia bacterium]
MTDKQEWQGKHVTVVGLGIEGEDLARYFATAGANVTVSAAASEAVVRPRIDALAGLDIDFRLGGNDVSHIDGADLIAVSQGVPQGIPMLTAARDRGIPIESMTTLFLDRWPGPVCGITGSSGKTTTTSLVDAIFTAAGRDHVLGGNIGRGLLAHLEDPSPDAWAVLEMSHTQLVLTRTSPDVAAITNVTPNHLDQFSWEDYVGLKRKVFAFQDESKRAVFNLDDPVSQELRPEAKARVFLFATSGDHGLDGAYLESGSIFWRLDGRTERVVAADEIPLRGFHNVANVAAATAIAAACEIGPEAVAAAVRSFHAPAHRIELVATVDGVAYYNDSIATAPERTLAALRSFDEPIVLLLGGREKKLPLDQLMTEAKARCRAAVCFGEAGPLFADAAEHAGIEVVRVGPLAEAVEAASRVAQRGDVVLLSPACTSFDAYPNFEARGVDFRALVSRLSQGARP